MAVVKCGKIALSGAGTLACALFPESTHAASFLIGQAFSPNTTNPRARRAPQAPRTEVLLSKIAMANRRTQQSFPAGLGQGSLAEGSRRILDLHPGLRDSAAWEPAIIETTGAARCSRLLPCSSVLSQLSSPSPYVDGVIEIPPVVPMLRCWKCGDSNRTWFSSRRKTEL
jgi:hypothetical protein